MIEEGKYLIIKPDSSGVVNSEDKKQVEFSIIVDKDDEFDLYFNFLCYDSQCSLLVHINNFCYGDLVLLKDESEKDKRVSTIKLNGGKNVITFERRWGADFKINYIKLKNRSLKSFTPSFELSNKNAIDECKKLMDFFSNIFGKKIIAGQHTNSSVGPEIEYIRYITGKKPALRGFDFLSYTSNTITKDMTGSGFSEVEINKGSVEAAIKWYKEYGGIITFCWHWYAPTGGVDRTFYTKNTDFDLEKALDTTTTEHQLLLKDIGMIAQQLTKLCELKIPILWRPLHEADGKWFWWGAKGPEPYKRLYYLLYDILVNHYKLNNLIWVWNAPDESWLVDSNFFDIAGVDMYAPQRNYGPLRINFEKICDITQYNKPITLSENGPIPDIDLLFDTKTYWLWFMPWFGDFVLSESFNSFKHLLEVYNNEKVITLDRFELFRA